MIEPPAYHEYVNNFVRIISTLGDAVNMILLYGSVRRNEIRPGTSDLIDAVVVLSSEIFIDEDRFYHAFRAMTESCIDMSRSGLPFHPFHYIEASTNGWSTIPIYLPAWTSEEHSQILLGSDQRSKLHSSDTEYEFMQGWYFSLSHSIYRQVASLSSDDDKVAFVSQLLKTARTLPSHACFACCHSVDRTEAFREIRHILPDVDTHMLDILLKMTEQPAVDLNSEIAHNLIVNILNFTEHLYELTSRWVQEHYANCRVQ